MNNLISITEMNEIVNENISIKQRVYKLMRKYNLSYGTLFTLFGIDKEDERAIYLKRLYFQFIKEEEVYNK